MEKLSWQRKHPYKNIFIKTVKKPSKLQQQKKVIIQNYRATVAHNTISANQRSDSVTQSLSTNSEETIKFFIYSVILIATPIGKPSTFNLGVDHKKILN